jgi:zeaxanthin glucosyltransferase
MEIESASANLRLVIHHAEERDPVPAIVKLLCKRQEQINMARHRETEHAYVRHRRDRSPPLLYILLLPGMEAKHFAGFCEPGPSHIKNMSAIGRELVRRGHRFTLFHVPELEAQVLHEGVEFAPLRQSVTPGSTPIPYPVESRQEGTSIKNFLSFAKESATLVCDVAPAALRAARVDCVLADMAQPAAATAAEHLGLPYVTICHAVPLHRSASVPPDFLPWTYRTSWWAKVRNTLAYQFRDLMIYPLHRRLNHYRARWGLRPYRIPEHSFSPFAQITQLVKEFDFPRPNLPRCFHYVGPYRRIPRDQTPFPFDRLDGRPLVYASLGTSQGDRSDLWSAIGAGCAELNVQLVISLGGAPRSNQIARLEGSPLVVDYAPQFGILTRASAMITHAGLNTVMEALAAGVPMLAVPITGDQFGVAARIAYRGVGRIVPLAGFQAAGVKSAVKQLLSEPAYRMRAAEVRRAIEGTRGAEAAAEIVEQVVLTHKPVLC